MRILKITTLIFLFSGLISSCQKEYFKKPVLDPNTPISFSNDLQPIMTAKCASSGCHDKSYPPNLLKDKAYLALIRYTCTKSKPSYDPNKQGYAQG
jgi:hypothetical protein